MNEQPQSMSIWFHRKTGGLYLVLCVALCSTNGDENGKKQAVVYKSLSDGCFYYRELSEFMDGRFVERKTE